MASFLLACWPKQRRDTLLKDQAGILVTQGLQEAIDRCKGKVRRLAAECRQCKRKYRDLEFDLLEDRERCLYRWGCPSKPKYNPADVRRIPDIVDDPRFLVDGATAGDICQGALGNCWFLSALTVVATAGLIETICVERNEEMGIYGFIFWRDSGWVEVIVDDLVFTKVRPWEALSSEERDLYRNDRRTYNSTARKGLFTNLYFAKSSTTNETWVPLIEKAYAKLHGDYESLENGFTSEGVEDLTGGVSTLIYRGDIPNTDEFWDEELSKVGESRLFACFTPGSSPGGADRDLQPLGALEIEGLLTNHAYSITKAIKFTSKDGVERGRFLRIRNPWGRKEWSGRWSDGSEEWNEKWTEELREALGNYRFGDDGEFVQEYQDFLECWGIIERSRLFNKGWIMSSQWLQMPPDTHLRPWSLGEVSFTVDITSDTGSDEASKTIIVLTQRDTRYFKDLSGPYLWSMDFLLYRCGEPLPIARSVHSTLWDRSVKLEIPLAPGEYVVHARLDCKRKKVDPSTAPVDWRKRHRKKMEHTASAMIAANCNHSLLPFQYLSVPPAAVAGQDLNEIEFQLNYETLQARFESQTQGPLFGSPMQVQGDLQPTPPNISDLSSRTLTHLEIQHSAGASTSDLLSPAETGLISSASSIRMRRDALQVPSLFQHRDAYSESDGDHPPVDDMAQMQTPARVNSLRQASNPRHFPGRYPTSTSQSSVPNHQGSLGGDSHVSRDSLPWEKVAKKKLHFAKTDAQKYKHTGFCCKECQAEISGPMFRCLEIMCHGCHLCFECMDKCLDHKAHKFIISTCAEDDKLLLSEYKSKSIRGSFCHPNTEAADPAKDAEPPSDLVLGLRVYTKNNAKATVKGQLRTGSILRNHYFTPKATDGF